MNPNNSTPPQAAWGVFFGWNATTDIWSVVKLEPGDGPHTLIRLKNGSLGNIHSFHASEDLALSAMHEAMKEAQL